MLRRINSYCLDQLRATASEVQSEGGRAVCLDEATSIDAALRKTVRRCRGAGGGEVEGEGGRLDIRSRRWWRVDAGGGRQEAAAAVGARESLGPPTRPASAAGVAW